MRRVDGCKLRIILQLHFRFESRSLRTNGAIKWGELILKRLSGWVGT